MSKRGGGTLAAMRENAALSCDCMVVVSLPPGTSMYSPPAEVGDRLHQVTVAVGPHGHRVDRAAVGDGLHCLIEGVSF